jgi:hypothetical protein
MAQRGAVRSSRPSRPPPPAQPFQHVEASQLAAAPDSRQRLQFYTHTLCPYAQRVWIALLEKVRVARPPPASLLLFPAPAPCLAAPLPAAWQPSRPAH